MTAPWPVVTQQYSSVSFVSLRFHSREKEFGVGFKYVIISFSLYVSKLLNSKSALLEIA